MLHYLKHIGVLYDPALQQCNLPDLFILGKIALKEGQVRP